jgi:hypothetical protein
VKGQESKGGAVAIKQGAEWMGICHHEQETGPPRKSGFFIFLAMGLITSCTFIV